MVMISRTCSPRLLAPLLLAILLAHGSGHAAAPAEREALARGLAVRLGHLPDKTATPAPQPFECLDRYPLTATAAYLLLGDDPNLLRSLYPRLQASVTDLFSPARTVGPGLVPGGADESLSPGASLSPALNALASLELWSLHLISWKTGAYEDALEYLAWARRLSGAVTQSFYVPDRGRFYPAGAPGRPLPLETPAELLPLVLDETLGRAARGRVAASFIAGIEKETAAGRAPFDRGGMWNDPLARPVVLDLLSTIPGEGPSLAAAIASVVPRDTAALDPAKALWIDFWRSNPSRRLDLFPSWRVYPAFVNLALLLDRESIVEADGMRAFSGGIDTLGRALAMEHLTVDSFAAANAVANDLMTRIERFSALLATPKERWRVVDEAKWTRLSPRTKRLVSESCAAALVELVAVKTELSLRLEAGTGIAFGLSFPEDPVVKGEPAAFAAVLESARETLSISGAVLRIGDLSWTVAERGVKASAAPGAPLRFTGTLALPPREEPGIVPLAAALEIRAGGRLLDLRRRESVVLAPPYRVSIDLPAGKRLGDDPLPVAIAIRYRPAHDIRGTVDGTFMKELATTPELPAHFLADASRDRTDLVVTVAPRERLSPGRYPFSLSISLGAGTIARFDESLVLPFRWLYLGPMTADDAFRRGPDYQKDLFGRYAIGGAAAVRWREAAGDAFDTDGALLPERLVEATAGRCILLYTAIDAPGRMKLRWSIETTNTVSIWINGAPVLPAGSAAGAASAAEPVEIRKGPNSILVAACWSDAPGGVLFDLVDENGYPAAGLGNELETIIDGFDRLLAPEAPPEAAREAASKRMRQISFALVQPGASEVSVIGSFNNWDPAATPMKRDAAGVWRAALVLMPGRYPYKFSIDRKSKIVDPANALTEPDGFGGRNSVLEVK